LENRAFTKLTCKIYIILKQENFSIFFRKKWSQTAAMTIEKSISQAMGENVNSHLIIISRRKANRTNSQKNWRWMNSPKGTRREMILRFIGLIIYHGVDGSAKSQNKIKLPNFNNNKKLDKPKKEKKISSSWKAFNAKI
jgi:hypothetical protein